jgi:hypothetical protein
MHGRHEVLQWALAHGAPQAVGEGGAGGWGWEDGGVW